MEETNLENPVQIETEQNRVNEPEQVPMMPNNNMILAILTTVCCCLPLGIVAVIKANQVRKLYFDSSLIGRRIYRIFSDDIEIINKLEKNLKFK